MQTANISALEDLPTDLPSDPEERKQWVWLMAQKIVDHLWQQPSHEDLESVKSAYQASDDDDDGGEDNFHFCVCREGIPYIFACS